jgi:hypothetical protein
MKLSKREASDMISACLEKKKRQSNRSFRWVALIIFALIAAFVAFLVLYRR